MGEFDRFKRCQEHLSLWLRSSLTGCHFATSFSATRPLKLDYYTPVSEAIDLAAIGSFIDGTAANEVVAVVLFPSARTPGDLVRTLITLYGDERWQLGEEPWPKGRERPDSVALSLTWKTPSGDGSDAMGIAPLGTMPVTRRAPYVDRRVGRLASEPAHSTDRSAWRCERTNRSGQRLSTAAS